jgi:hypothetical protein
MVWGSLLGSMGGAIVGGVYGVCAGDLALGLDGAIVGNLGCAILDGLYGVFLGWTDRPTSG